MAELICRVGTTFVMNGRIVKCCPDVARADVRVQRRVISEEERLARLEQIRLLPTREERVAARLKLIDEMGD